MSQDKSGLSPQERHQIIIDKLKEFKKKTKVFHMRWTPGDNLDEKVLKSTPAFWYMRFGWSRPQIESMFYDARVYIDTVTENALDAVFGTDGKGPRWLPADMQEEKRAKWNKRGYYKTQPWWKVKQLGAMAKSPPPPKSYKDEPWAYDKEWRLKNRDYQGDDASYGSHGGKKQGGNHGNGANDPKSMNVRGRRRSLLNTNLSQHSEKIWSKMSDYGAKNDKINYKKFREALNSHGIVMDDAVSKKLFDQFADKDGYMDFRTLQELLKKLDQNQVKVGMDIGSFSLKDLDNDFNAILLMKRVLLAAAMEIPFDVTDFMNVGGMTGSTMPAQMLLNKLITRDATWNERLKIMEDVANNLGTNPEYDELLEPQNASDLLMGWTAQMLDERPQVSGTAIDQLPTIFHEVAEKSHPDVAMGHLDDVIDGIFNVLDNKRHEANHEAAKKALADIVDEVVENQDAEAVLYLAGLLGEKTNIENCTDPNARAAALDNLKRIMMGDNAAVMDPNKMPKNPKPQAEWKDIGTKQKPGPSDKLMDQGHDKPDQPKYYPNGIPDEDLIHGKPDQPKHYPNGIPDKDLIDGKPDQPKYYPNGIPDKDLIDGENSNTKGKRVPNSSQSKTGKDKKNPKWGGDGENYGSNGTGNPDDYNNYDDDEPTNQYGGGDAPDYPESDMGDDPSKPRRKKGKENDLVYKFGGRKNNPKSDNKNEPNNKGPDQYGKRNPNSQKTGGPQKAGTTGDDSKTTGPSNRGGGSRDPDDLDDDGNPNDPGDKDGKRGGTKRQGTNGKGDFDGKFGDNSNQGKDPYGGPRIGSKAPRNIKKKGAYNQAPNDKGKGQKGGAVPNDDNDEKRGLDQSPLTSNEIGEEFRNVINDAVEQGLLDPNKKNKENAAKLADAINNMSPENFAENLDGDAKKRYLNWKHGPMKPYKRAPPKGKKLPPLGKGKTKVHEISQQREIQISPPTMPDI